MCTEERLRRPTADVARAADRFDLQGFSVIAVVVVDGWSTTVNADAFIRRREISVTNGKSQNSMRSVPSILVAGPDMRLAVGAQGCEVMPK